MVYLVGHSWEECIWYSLVNSLEWDVPGIVSWTVLGEMFMVYLVGYSWKGFSW